MQLKKSPKADLEKNKGIYLQIGFVFVLTVVLVAFEWSNSDKNDNSLGQLMVEEEFEEDIINTFRDELPPPPPPPPPQVIEVLTIVEDDAEIDDNLDIKDSDDDSEITFIEVEEESETDEVFEFFQLEEVPVFPGGEEGMRKHIAKNTIYPQICIENEIEGRVFVQFVISKTGQVTDVKVVRPVDPALDKEAVRVVQSLPNWKPGTQRGKPVKVAFRVPVTFKLQKR